MNNRSFALIAETDVFYVFTLSSSISKYDEICQALANSPLIIETTNMTPIPTSGWDWDGNNFIPPLDCKYEEKTDRPMLRFAVVHNGKVIFNINYSVYAEKVMILTAGLRSNPVIVEITNLPTKPDVGWTWNGSEFLEPYIGW